MKPLPPPVVSLTLEQQFKVASLISDIERASPDQMVTICESLLNQNFVLKNSLNNIIHAWYETNTTGTDLPEERIT